MKSSEQVARRRSKLRDYRHVWFTRNTTKELARIAARREEAKALIVLYKSRPCADCGTSYPPYVMDFDHVRGEKTAGIGTGALHHSHRRLLEEIAKCDVVCANCHRERTYSRAQQE